MREDVRVGQLIIAIIIFVVILTLMVMSGCSLPKHKNFVLYDSPWVGKGIDEVLDTPLYKKAPLIVTERANGVKSFAFHTQSISQNVVGVMTKKRILTRRQVFYVNGKGVIIGVESLHQHLTE